MLGKALPKMLVACLVLLAACGSAQPPPLAATPRPVSLSRPSTAALARTTIVLDPGHNGASAAHPAEINRQVPTGRGGTKACNTTGTSTNSGYPEHAFNWDVALRVRDALTAHGIRVVLTRPNDTGVGPCVDERAAIANRAGAAGVISIHADGAAPSGRGFHVAYSDPPLNSSQGAPSIALANALVTSLRGGHFLSSNYMGSNGLNPRSDLAGLNLAKIPAVLVECANMRNAHEAGLVSTPAGRARYATAITQGIMAWLASRSRH